MPKYNIYIHTHTHTHTHTGHLEEVVSGQLDANIDTLGTYINASYPHAFYLRIGYEFDSLENNYDAEMYKMAFQRIVTRIKGWWWLFIMHHTPYTIYHTPYTIHHIPYTIYHIPYTIHHIPYTIHHTPYTIHHIPYT
ncbi:hypothetical protein EON63_05220, partial [archaeon]